MAVDGRRLIWALHVATKIENSSPPQKKKKKANVMSPQISFKVVHEKKNVFPMLDVCNSRPVMIGLILFKILLLILSPLAHMISMLIHKSKYENIA